MIKEKYFRETNRRLMEDKYMGFWVFMLFMDLIIPFTMIGFGKLFMTKPPQDINTVFGYRTTMSMKNKDTWEFAHKYCGKLWFKCGLTLLPLSAVPLIFVFNKGTDITGTVGGIVCAVQLLLLIGSILPTEAALKKTFDRNGICR